jgi:hypothetical protein
MLKSVAINQDQPAGAGDLVKCKERTTAALVHGSVRLFACSEIAVLHLPLSDIPLRSNLSCEIA